MSLNSLIKIDLKSIISIWLDVSKSKIDICCILKEDKDLFFQIQNSKQWISKFINILVNSDFNKEIPLIIESTWDFDTLACILFSENKFNIKEINPIITKNYVKSTIRWTKTDKTDAKALANIWIINKNDLFTFSKSKKIIEINKKISLVSTLEKQMISLKRSVKSFLETSLNLELDFSSSINDIENTIKVLEKNIKSLQKEIELDSLWDDTFHNENISIINSIIWISAYMSKVFYVSFACKNFSSKEAMYAFIWFDPKLKNSWDSFWKAHISKRWNSYIRKKLFQSAFCGITHCKLFKDIYEKHLNNWKHHFTWVIAVIKKIVHIIYSLLKNRSFFNPTF